MQFLLILLLFLAVQAQAVTLSFGDQLDPYDATNGGVGFFSNADTPDNATGFIAGIQSNLTVSVASGFGSNFVNAGPTGAGSYSFTYTPNTNGSGSADFTMEYSFDNLGAGEETLNFSGVTFLQLNYDLNNSGPLALTVDFDGVSNIYNLADGIDTFLIPIIDNTITSNITLGFSLTGANANFTITSPITAEVPEPTTIASLLVLAVLLFFAYQRRRQPANGQPAPSPVYIRLPCSLLRQNNHRQMFANRLTQATIKNY